MRPSPFIHGSFRDRGFTLIELVALICVTLVLAAALLSAHRTHTVRAHIASAIRSSAPAKRHVERAFLLDAEPPADRVAAGLASEKHYDDPSIESINVTDGRIDIRFAAGTDPAIAGRILSLTPYETADLTIIWVCGNELPGTGLKPLGFAGGGRQAVQVLSTIEPRFLPSYCR